LRFWYYALHVYLNASGSSSNVTGTYHTAGCGDGTSSGNMFTIRSLNADGSGTANLTCGTGCGWNLNIQVSPDRSKFNVIDVSPANPENSSRASPSISIDIASGESRTPRCLNVRGPHFSRALYARSGGGTAVGKCWANVMEPIRFPLISSSQSSLFDNLTPKQEGVPPTQNRMSNGSVEC
jgi:hypothetical protein